MVRKDGLRSAFTASSLRIAAEGGEKIVHHWDHRGTQGESKSPLLAKPARNGAPNHENSVSPYRRYYASPDPSTVQDDILAFGCGGGAPPRRPTRRRRYGISGRGLGLGLRRRVVLRRRSSRRRLGLLPGLSEEVTGRGFGELIRSSVVRRIRQIRFRVR